MILQSPGVDRAEHMKAKVEAIDEVYKVKTLNYWEIEKGNEVCSIHVIVRKDADSNRVNEKIKQALSVKDVTVQLVYLS